MDDENYFRAWFRIADLTENIGLSKPLRKPALNYYRNMKRVHDSWICTPCFAGASARLAWAEAMAASEVGAKSPFWEEKRDHHLSVQMQEDLNSGSASRRSYQQAGKFMLLAMQRHPGLPMKDGLDAILSSTLIHASAAMEVCLGEIWKAAGKLPAIQGRHVETERLRIYYLAQVTRGVIPPVPPRGGGLPKNFSSLAGSRGQYAVAFCRDSSDVDTAMASYDLDALALVRNILLHKNGVPDSQFREQAKGIPILDEVVALPPHRKISLEGKFVSSLLTSSLRAVKAVVKSVDQWLQRNK